MAKIFTGTVISTKMAKTLVVKVVSQRVHPLYRKIMKRSKNYKVHYENEEVLVGDQVMIIETKPISKDKKFKLTKVIKATG